MTDPLGAPAAGGRATSTTEDGAAEASDEEGSAGAEQGVAGAVASWAAPPRHAGLEVDATDGTTVRHAVGGLLDRLALDIEGPVVVVPDVHYPYHPSTGLVTNPETVAGLLAWLREGGIEEVTLGVAGSEALDGATTADLLGFERLADAYDAEVVDLDTEPHRQRSAVVDGRSVALDVPDRLVESTVVVVPTVRTDGEGDALTGGCATLLHAAGTDRVDGEHVAAALTLLAPALTLVDATYAYSGGPRATRRLLASRDPVVVDLAVAEALGYDATPYLGRYADITNTRLEGLSRESLAAALPQGRPDSTGGNVSPALKTGYRLYARLTGDAVPPTFLGED